MKPGGAVPPPPPGPKRPGAALPLPVPAPIPAASAAPAAKKPSTPPPMPEETLVKALEAITLDTKIIENSIKQLIARDTFKQPYRILKALESWDFADEAYAPLAPLALALKNKLPVVIISRGMEGTSNHHFIKQGIYAQSTVGNREKNEDAFAIYQLNGKTYLLVLDGMGGHSNGALASDMALRIVLEAIESGLDVPQAMQKAHDELARINAEKMSAYTEEDIEKMKRGLIDDPKMGTTISVATIEGDDLTVHHIGDSEIFLIRKNGEPELLTFPHKTQFWSPVTLQALGIHSFVTPAKKELIEKIEQVEDHTIALALGMVFPAKVPAYSTKLEPGDCLLMVSDGYTDPIRIVKTLKLLKQCKEAGLDLPETVEKLIEIAKKDQEAQVQADNITILLHEKEEITSVTASQMLDIAEPEPAREEEEEVTRDLPLPRPVPVDPRQQIVVPARDRKRFAGDDTKTGILQLTDTITTMLQLPAKDKDEIAQALDKNVQLKEVIEKAATLIADKNNAIASLQKSVAELQRGAGLLEAEADALRKSAGALSFEQLLEELKNKLSELTQQHAELSANLAAVEAQITDKNGILASLGDLIAKLKKIDEEQRKPYLEQIHALKEEYKTAVNTSAIQALKTRLESLKRSRPQSLECAIAQESLEVAIEPIRSSYQEKIRIIDERMRKELGLESREKWYVSREGQSAEIEREIMALIAQRTAISNNLAGVQGEAKSLIDKMEQNLRALLDIKGRLNAILPKSEILPRNGR
jgi:protein phosphatase